MKLIPWWEFRWLQSLEPTEFTTIMLGAMHGVERTLWLGLHVYSNFTLNISQPYLQPFSCFTQTNFSTKININCETAYLCAKHYLIPIYYDSYIYNVHLIILFGNVTFLVKFIKKQNSWEMQKESLWTIHNKPHIASLIPQLMSFLKIYIGKAYGPLLSCVILYSVSMEYILREMKSWGPEKANIAMGHNTCWKYLHSHKNMSKENNENFEEVKEWAPETWQTKLPRLALKLHLITVSHVQY